MKEQVAGRLFLNFHSTCKRPQLCRYPFVVPINKSAVDLKKRNRLLPLDIERKRCHEAKVQSPRGKTDTMFTPFEIHPSSPVFSHNKIDTTYYFKEE